MKMIKKYEEKKQKISKENYLKKKNIKREYGRNKYHNISEEKKKIKRISKKL